MAQQTAIPVADMIVRADQAMETLHAYLAQLTPEQISGPRNQDGWSVKDHVAHLAIWLHGLAALLRREPRWLVMDIGDARGRAGTLDEVNQRLQKRYANTDWNAVRTMLDAGYKEVRHELTLLDDAALAQTYASYQPAEQIADHETTIGNRIAANTYEHVALHLPWMRAIVASAAI